MNNISLIFIALLLVGCGELQVTDNTHSVDEEKFKILPLKIKIIGQLNEIEDVGLLTPSVIFDIRDSIVYNCTPVENIKVNTSQFIDCIVTTKTGRELASIQASHQFKLYTGLEFPL